MEILELVELADWFKDQGPSVRTAYNNLLTSLQHNATQNDKQPLETHLARLTAELEGMSFDQLSLEQLAILERLGVREYLGRDGILFLDETVRTANYDPATAVSRVQIVTSSIDNATATLNSYRDVIAKLNLEEQDLQAPSDRIVIRVGFQSDAAIDNVTDWRDAGKEWYDIIRGIALAANESPEDTKVLGAATGSIILILGGTVAVTSMLALISKNITSVAKDVITVGVERENLRQKKLLTTAMESEFKKLEDKKRSDALKTVMNELKTHLHKLAQGDAKVALEAAVKKLLDFSEKGGVVDFVAPPEASGEENEEEMDAGRKLLADARRIIHEYQGERESLRLLTDQSSTANDNEEG